MLGMLGWAWGSQDHTTLKKNPASQLRPQFQGGPSETPPGQRDGGAAPAKAGVSSFNPGGGTRCLPLPLNEAVDSYDKDSQ